MFEGELERRVVLRAMGALPFAGLLGSREAAAAGQPWRAYQANEARTGYLPDAVDEPGTNIGAAWTHQPAGGAKTSPVYLDGTVYVGAGEKTYALSTTDGSVEWSRRYLAGEDTALAVTDTALYLHTGDGSYLWALDPDTGEQLWSRETSSTNRDFVYVRSEDLLVLSNGEALDGTTGDVVWTSSVDARGARPAASGDTIYVSPEEHVVALDASDGTERWRARGGEQAFTAPTVGGTNVYVGNEFRTEFLAFDANDGTERWRTTGLPGESPFPVAVAESTVYVPYRTALVALETGTGTEQWRFEPDGEGERITGPPVVLGESLYIGAKLTEGGETKNGLLVLDDETGNRVIHYTDSVSGSPVDFSQPPASDGSRIYGGGGAVVYALEAGGGGGVADLQLTMADDTASAGGVATIETTLANEGDRRSTGIEVTVDVPSGEWTAAGELPDIDTLDAGETRSVDLDLNVPPGASGEYRFEGRVEDAAGNTDTASATVTVVPAGSVVIGPDGTPATGATVRLFETGDHFQQEPRLMGEATTDDDGRYELPATFGANDRELVVTAELADWFATRRYAVEDIRGPGSYGELRLDRQLLFGPTLAETDEGFPIGVVTTWRYRYAEDVDVLYVEITNAVEGERPWNVVGVDALGLSAGDFWVSFPDDGVEIDPDTGFGEEDPIGDGGVHLFSSNQGDNNDPFQQEFFHPLQDHAGLPFYETTKRVEGLSEPDSEVFDYGDWHVTTPGSSEKADELEETVRERAEEFPYNVCKIASAGAVECPNPVAKLFEVLDLLELLNKILADDNPQVAELGHAYRPYGAGARDVSFRPWTEDNAAFGDAGAVSVVYQVPLRVDREAVGEAVEYTAQADWLRPYNERGRYRDAISTGPLDVSIRSPEGPIVTPGQIYNVEAVLHNRTTDELSPAEVTVEFLDRSGTRRPNLTLAPGESFPITSTIRVPDDAAGDIDLTVTASDDDGNEVTATKRLHAPEASAATIRMAMDGEESADRQAGDATRTAGGGSADGVATVTAGESVTLTAPNRVTRRGGVTCTWDLDGDGTTDRRGRTITHRFDDPGTQEVRLSVTHEDGTTETATTTVDVREPTPTPTATPTATDSPTPTDGDAALRDWLPLASVAGAALGAGLRERLRDDEE